MQYGDVLTRRRHTELFQNGDSFGKIALDVGAYGQAGTFDGFPMVGQVVKADLNDPTDVDNLVVPVEQLQIIEASHTAIYPAEVAKWGIVERARAGRWIPCGVQLFQSCHKFETPEEERVHIALDLSKSQFTFVYGEREMYLREVDDEVVVDVRLSIFTVGVERLVSDGAVLHRGLGDLCACVLSLCAYMR